MEAIKIVERELIATCVSSLELMKNSVESIEDNDLSFESNRAIWNAFKSGYITDNDLSLTTAIKYVDKKYFDDLVEFASTGINIESVISPDNHLKYLRNARKSISIRQLAASIAMGNEVAEGREHEVENMLSASSHKSEVVKTKEATLGFINTISDRMSGTCSGIDTGMRVLDDYLGGLAPQALTVVASRPAVGKSTILLQWALSIPEVSRKKVAYISTDMNSNEVMARIIQHKTGLQAKDVLRGRISEIELSTIAQELGKIASDNMLSIYEMIGAPITHIVSTMMLLHKKGVEVFMIDQLTGIRLPSGDKSWYEIGVITKALRKFGRTTGATVVLAHQLKRESDRRKEDDLPTLSDLKGSGEIEQDASNVLFLHRFRGKNETVLIIAKNRMGPKTVIDLGFNGRKISFKENGIWKA